MKVLESPASHLSQADWSWIDQPRSSTLIATGQPSSKAIDLLRPLRQWLDEVKMDNPAIAHSICRFIPTQCPFARKVSCFGKTLFQIPPLCKLNPLYEEVVGLRFRALCYLADECGEDVTPYC